MKIGQKMKIIRLLCLPKMCFNISSMLFDSLFDFLAF